jgi:hypothetical protein
VVKGQWGEPEKERPLTYLEHDLGPDGANRAPARPVPAQRTPAGAPSAPLLDLQRLAGNAAVSQAMKTGRLGQDVPVQRVEEDTEDSSEEEMTELDTEDDTEAEVADETGDEEEETESDTGEE